MARQRGEQKLSDDKNLDEILFSISPPEEVIDAEITQPIPNLKKQRFSLSCPYRVGDDQLYPARPIGAKGFFDTGFSRKVVSGALKEHAATDYTERHLRFMGHLDTKTIGFVITSVTPALYDKSQEAADGKDPLNAFRVTGVLYKEIATLR